MRGWILILLFLVTGSCSKEEIDNFLRNPDTSSIASTFQTTIPVAFAARQTWNYLETGQSEYVTVGTPCSAPPCTFLLNVAPDDYTSRVSGNELNMTVAGLWASETDLIMSIAFTKFEGGSTFVLQDLITIPSIIDIDGRLKVVYADQDINRGQSPLLSLDLSQEEIDIEFDRFEDFLTLDSAIIIEQRGWLIELQETSDPDQFVYELTGGGQFINVSDASTGIIQMAMWEAEMHPGCPLNPYEGYAIVRNVSVTGGTPDDPLELGSALFTFDDVCTGNAKVEVATGNYIGSIGRTLPLNIGR